jgi:PAS domain S-box-containing protein
MEPERFTEQNLTSLKPGDHLCCIYSGEPQLTEILTQYLEDGIKQGQKVLYVYEGGDSGSTVTVLKKPGSIFAEALACGQLVLFSSDETYLRSGAFNSQEMIHLIGTEVEQALAEGYSSVRLSGDGNWVARNLSVQDSIIQYEACLNQLPFAEHVIILCLYNRSNFDPNFLHDLLLTHPRVAVGKSVYDNFYYLPPEVFFQKDRAAARFDQWLNNLRDRHQMEWDLERARSGLSRQVEEQISRLTEVNQQLYSEIRQRLGTEYALLQANNALRVSENQFRSLVESSPVGIMMTDENGIVIEWNTSAEEIYQAPSDRILGRPIWEVRAEFLPSDQQTPAAFEQLKESLQDFFLTGDAPWLFQYEDRDLVWPDGEQRYIQRIRFPIRTEKGYMLGSIIHDVTDKRRVELELERYRRHLETMVEQRTVELQHEIHERQLIEEVLRESEGRYRALVNQAPLLILVAQDGHYVFANPAVVHRLGYSSAYDLIGRNTADIVSAESREVFSKRLDQVLGGGPAEPAMITLQCKDGKVYYSENTSVPILYQGRPAVLIIGQDVTERMRYEQQLMSSLSEKEVMLREIHHRVKNNLNVIIALIDLQRANQSEPQVLQIFKELQSRVYTMALVHDSIYRSPSLAKIDCAGYLQTLVSYLYAVYKPPASASRFPPIQFKIEVEDISLKVETAIPCGLIVNELVTNSLKYAFPVEYTSSDPDGCQITVKLAHNPGLNSSNAGNDLAEKSFTLTVSDNGIGFSTGYNWRSTSTLGMQLVQVLSRQLGGQIEPVLDHGVTWNLTFSERK